MDVIVLDGDQRSALAVTRSLGRKGIQVAVGAEKTPSLSSRSRYCARSFVYPSPYRDPAGFLEAVRNFANRSAASVLFPVTDVTVAEVLSNRKELPGGIAVPFVDYGKFMQVTDKIRLFQLGRDLNVPIPATFLSTEFEDRESLIAAAGKSGYPLVVKPSFSRIRTANGWRNEKVHYAADEMELRSILSREVFLRFPFLVQERIEGPGVGIFLLMNHGEVAAKFAHRRIREKPPSGGVSVLCESVEPPADALKAAERILSHLEWTGVAMVEFKIDREENAAKLMEVNARFWGSLQLAISSGVDFPYLLYRLALGEKVEAPEGYTIGLKSRWELGDLDHLLIRLLHDRLKLNLPPGHPARGTAVKEFVADFFRRSVRNEILRAEDPAPFFHEMNTYVRNMFH